MRETPHEDPRLFDLPLAPSSAEGSSSRRGRRGGAPSEPPESLPLFEAEPEEPAVEPEGGSEAGSRHSARARPRALPPPPPALPFATLAARARGALGDLAILGSVGTVAVAGARWLDAPVGWAQGPALLAFLLSWSFLYFVVSLAFWGQTPGMAWAGLVARSGVDEPLSFGQTARRWAATWLTWALAGLPGLLALGGRSLADRASGSNTFELGELDSPDRQAA